MRKKEKEQKPSDGKRYIALILAIVLIFTGFTGRLVQWQLVEGEEYEEISKNQDTQFIRLSAARGEILDSEGTVLVGNHLTYAVIFNAMTMAENRNPTLISLLTILKERGESWIDEFPIIVDEEGNYAFDESKESEITYLKSSAMLNLQEYATANDCMTALISRYNCKGYSQGDTRDLLSVRYGMHKKGFSRTSPYTIADDITSETIGVINERLAELPGVETKVIATRHYGEDTTLASHVVGSVGAISQSQYETQKENDNLYSADNVSGYSLDDKVGSSGIEKAFESELRGTYGKEVVTTDSSGDVIITSVTEAPKSGNSVQLTLRADLQAVANKSLRENVLANPATKNVAGAAVLIDVEDGGILVASNYPTYDLDSYANDSDYYTAVSEDTTNKPLYNRAFQGRYIPGSVFKPLVAIAALEEGTIYSGLAFSCPGFYEFSDGLKLGCMGTHGYETVTGAISASCNVFFYNTGLQLGITKMNAYAEYFGLGQVTGVEIDEDAGRMSNPEEYLENHGVVWNPDIYSGNTAQAAIGQLDSEFTPLQLASYCAAIANNGKRYQAHLLDKIIDYNTGEVIEEYEPTVVMDANISSSTMDTVKYGMRLSASSGTASDVFANYAISVCAKTGTAETGNDKANLTFIAFAPAENPEVAVAVVMEYGNEGSYAKNVAKDILDAYFELEDEDEDGDAGEDGTADADSVDPDNSDGDTEGDAENSEEEEDDGVTIITDGSEISVGAFYDPETDGVFKKEEDWEDGSEDGSSESSSEGPAG